MAGQMDRLGLRPGEDVIRQTGRHWIRLVGQAWLPVILIVAALVVALTIGPARAGWPPPWPLASTVALLAVIVLGLLRLVWVYVDWANDTLVLTSERVIWLERRLLFSETRREIPLDRVQNVAAEVEGVVPSWLGYGNLVVEASGSQPVAIAALPRPDAIRVQVGEAQTQARQARAELDRATNLAAVRAALAGEAPAPGAADLDLGRPVVWHRHWWFLLRAALLPALLLALAGVAAVLAAGLTLLSQEVRLALVAALALLALVGLLGALWAVLTWREDRYMIDGDKLLDIDKKPFRLYQEIKQTSLGKVQDVSYVIPHPLAHVLDYGDVHFDSAGETQRFTFDGVAHPRDVHAEISDRLAAYRRADQAQRQQQIREEALDLLRSYHELTRPQPDAGASPPNDSKQ